MRREKKRERGEGKREREEKKGREGEREREIKVSKIGFLRRTKRRMNFYSLRAID